MVCDNIIPGGFSKNSCLLWLSLLNSSTVYFEWGSGFTTRVSNTLVKSGTSIEGSLDWYNTMKKSYHEKHTRLRYVDIGETQAFSWPRNTSMGSQYINAIMTSDRLNDVVLIDGRWRVAYASNAPFRIPGISSLSSRCKFRFRSFPSNLQLNSTISTLL